MKNYGNEPPDGQEINRTARNAGKTDARGKVKEVADLMSTINKMPIVREDKIKSIRDALTSGMYSIDPLKIAEKILKEI